MKTAEELVKTVWGGSRDESAVLDFDNLVVLTRTIQRDALESAAKECDKEANREGAGNFNQQTARRLAAAIRSLLPKDPLQEKEGKGESSHPV